MAISYRTRVVLASQVIFEQIDVFQSDLYTRVTGLAHTAVNLTLRLNNQIVSWSLVNGVGVLDTQIVAGSVYWEELSPGTYGVRFLPNALGLWSLEIDYATTSQRIFVELDVVSSSVEQLITASFV